MPTLFTVATLLIGSLEILLFNDGHLEVENVENPPDEKSQPIYLDHDHARDLRRLLNTPEAIAALF